MSAKHRSEFSEELISIVAHELKTPVGVAKSFIDLIDKVGELNDHQKHYVDRALLALLRMEELIHNLLDFARLESGVPLDLETFDLAVTIRTQVELLEEIAAQRDITFKVDEAISDLPIEGDEALLTQVVSNLLSNAVKYNRDGGTVRVTVEKKQTVIHIDVTDTGLGIPLKDQPRIFERFYRANDVKQQKISGTGLGLAITERIIQLHGGHIRVESTPGEGSTFSFTLPKTVATISSSREHGVIDMPSVRREFRPPRSEFASELTDAVDDDTQESYDRPETDSRSEEQ